MKNLLFHNAVFCLLLSLVLSFCFPTFSWCLLFVFNKNKNSPRRPQWCPGRQLSRAARPLEWGGAQRALAKEECCQARGAAGRGARGCAPLPALACRGAAAACLLVGCVWKYKRIVGLVKLLI